jgi:hypothetical protein
VDQKRGDEIPKRMLQTKPKQHKDMVAERRAKPDAKRKLDAVLQLLRLQVAARALTWTGVGVLAAALIMKFTARSVRAWPGLRTDSNTGADAGGVHLLE